MADEPNPTSRRRKEPAPRVIEGSAKVIAEEPVDRPDTLAHAESPSNEGSAPINADAPAEPPVSFDAAAEAWPRAEARGTGDSPSAAQADPGPQLQDEAAQANVAGAGGDPGTGHSRPPGPALEKETAPQDQPPPRGRAVAARPRWWIYATGGIAVGAALIAIAWFGPFGSNGPTPPGVDPQQSAMYSKLVSSEQNIATFDSRLAAVEASVQQLASGQKELADMVASNARKLDDTNAGFSDAANTAKAAAAAAQAAQADAAADAGKTVDLKPMQDRIARIEAMLTQPKVEGKSTADPVVSPDTNNNSLDHAAALAVVAQTLIQAIDRGEPFPRQVAAMETLGADANQLALLKPLSDSGVPTAQSLSLKFSDLAKSMGPGETDAPKSGDFFGKIWQQATHLVRVRPVGGAEGESGAWVARIAAALARGDAAGGLAEWEKLPAPAKNMSQKWAAELKSRADAVAAASAILTSAIGNLGKPKS
jgi:hypothetical protein